VSVTTFWWSRSTAKSPASTTAKVGWSISSIVSAHARMSSAPKSSPAA
jgi:hypothetical protein